VLNRLERDFLVVVDLHRALADPGNAHGAIVVRVPLALVSPVGNPCKISGIEIGGQAFFKPVKLVRSDKMHLSGKRGLITGHPQIVGIGRYLGGKLGGIVISTHRRTELAGRHGKPRRRTKRKIAISVLKNHTGLRQPVQSRSVTDIVTIGAKRGCGQLVNLQKQDIGRFCHLRTRVLTAPTGPVSYHF